MVQWLRHRAANIRDMGLIPGQGAKIPHAMQHGQKTIIIIIFFKKDPIKEMNG